MRKAEILHCEKIPLIEQLHGEKGSALRRYRLKTVGDDSISRFLLSELVSMLFAELGGGAGYWIRKWCYGPLFWACGRNVILGKGLTVRHPSRIRIGDNVSLDDDVLLDASGSGDSSIDIGGRTIVSRNCVLQGKSGPVVIGEDSDIGCHTVITSVSGIYLESSVLIAARCYIGGARYHTGNREVPILKQGVYSRGPIRIGSGSWIGAGAIVLDGVTIGKGCVIGAGSVVTKDVPDFWIAAGVPAKPVQNRFNVEDAD